MDIYAKGKNISTFSLKNLFTKGEKYSDTILFYVDRIYGKEDLSDCNFFIRGVNENNEETQQSLLPEICGDKLALKWRVSDYFTACSGKLELELNASRINDSQVERVVKYSMEPVFVKPSPTGENEVLPDIADQTVYEINEAVSDGLDKIQTIIDTFDISAVEERLNNMDDRIGTFLARPEVVPVTQSEYNCISHKENVLYIIVKE